VAPLGVPQDPGRARLLRPPPRQEACPYANFCEQYDNFVPAPEFAPALVDQLADVQAVQDRASCGWRGLFYAPAATRLLQDLRRELFGPPEREVIDKPVTTAA